MEQVQNQELRKYCVYLITNLVNGKQYAGQTTTGVEIRWKRHCYKSIRPKNALGGAIHKYGAESFSVAVVVENLNKEEADREERRLIKELDLMNSDKGYNLTEGGEGGRQADSVREKMGWHLKGKGAFWMKGPDREEIMEKILISKGMKKDPLCGENYYAVELPTAQIIEEYKKGSSSVVLGKKYGCSEGTLLNRLRDAGVVLRDTDQRAKLLSEKGDWGFLKNILDHTGRKRSEETKQKMCDSNKQRRRDVDDKDVVRLYNEGYSTIKIAQMFSMTHPAIRRRLKINGVQMRGVGRSNGRPGTTQE